MDPNLSAFFAYKSLKVQYIASLLPSTKRLKRKYSSKIKPVRKRGKKNIIGVIGVKDGKVKKRKIRKRHLRLHVNKYYKKNTTQEKYDISDEVDVNIRVEKDTKQAKNHNQVWWTTSEQPQVEDDVLFSVCSTLSETYDPRKKAASLLQWILDPVRNISFMTTYWEKKPLLIKRSNPEYFSQIMNIEDIDRMLREHNVYFTKHLDVTVYENGLRQTFNEPGRATPQITWDYYKNGCSIRLLNPHIFLDKVYAVNSTLQEYFNCYVGSNVYLTPANSQGFAPHYDDIEAFILQIEGKKIWKLYEPRSPKEILPRFSSPNISRSSLGEPTYVYELCAGDILYFPRGWIHEGSTDEQVHSLHLTLSVYQHNSWIDLIEKVVPSALENAWKNDVSFREGLPLDYLQTMGTMYKNVSAVNECRREAIVSNVKHLMSKLIDYIDVDSAVDKLGAEFIRCALPPHLSKREKLCSQNEGSFRMKKDGTLTNDVQLSENTAIRMVRASACRFCKFYEQNPSTDDLSSTQNAIYKLFYSVDNSRMYQEEGQQFIIIPKTMKNCVKRLIASYPKFIPIWTLPPHNLDEKLQFLDGLWETGLIIASEPLKAEAQN